MKKVKVSVDKELDRLVPEKRSAIVTISTKEKQVSSRVDLPKREPENPLAKSEFEEKFRVLASTGSKYRIEHILSEVAELELFSDVNALTKLFHEEPN